MLELPFFCALKNLLLEMAAPFRNTKSVKMVFRPFSLSYCTFLTKIKLACTYFFSISVGRIGSELLK